MSVVAGELTGRNSNRSIQLSTIFDEQATTRADAESYLAIKDCLDQNSKRTLQKIDAAVALFISNIYASISREVGFMLLIIKRIRNQTGYIGVTYEEYNKGLRDTMYELVSIRRNELQDQLDALNVLASASILEQLVQSAIIVSLGSVSSARANKQTLIRAGAEYFKEQINSIPETPENTREIALALQACEDAKNLYQSDPDAAL